MSARHSRLAWAFGWLAILSVMVGCSGPAAPPAGKGQASQNKDPSTASTATTAAQPGAKKAPVDAPPATAKAEDVKAAVARIKVLGPTARLTNQAGRLTEIVIPDGSGLTADDFRLFGRLTDLKKLQIYNCRILNDEMAAHLSGLDQLTVLAITNSVINDPTVDMIVKSFPKLTDLDLSSNTNMTSGVFKSIAELSNLQRLILVQDRFNELSTRRLAKLQNLRALDLRGNMEAGDVTLQFVADLPKLTAFKHRSTAVTDTGMEHLSRNATLESLLIQDFAITDQSGPHLAKLPKLTQLEVFRCQAFGTEGVLALKGMHLQRLTLRDLPNVDDRALAVLDDLPHLRRLYLLELSSLTDAGLKHLGSLPALEVLEIGSVPQLTDATIDVITRIPRLKELSIRSTGVSDAVVDKLLAMPSLESLTFKENGAVSPASANRLTKRKWTKLDIGAATTSDSDAP